MSNWRELGEIPDSEDEDEYLDDDEVLPPPPTQNLVETAIPKINHAEDIWDYHGSDDEGQGNIPMSEVSPSLATPILQGQPKLSTISSPLTEDTAQNQVQPPVFHTETRSPFLVSTLEEVASRSGQDITDASGRTAGSARASGSNSTIAFISSPSNPFNYTATTSGSENDQRATDWEATEDASGHRRSLRPRKPIQEHPYLLENAQYSNFLRQHGVRPVKVTVNTDIFHPAGTLPDDDFSQYSQNGTLPPGTDITDSNSFMVTPRESIHLDISPNSSNPPQHHVQLVNESFASPLADAVDDTVLDQDLPDLDQLLNRCSQTDEKDTTVQNTPHFQPLTQRIRRRDIVYSDTPEPYTTIAQISDSPNFFTESSDSDGQQIAHRHPSRTSDRQNSSIETWPGLPASASVIGVPAHDFDSQERHDQQQFRETPETRNEFEGDTHQLVTEFGRHIRGVLPASWLRLDQQLSKNNHRQSSKRRLQNRLPNQQQRGIALTKAAVSGFTVPDTFPQELDEILTEYTADDVADHQVEISPSSSLEHEIDWIDESQAPEETHLDAAVAGSKRQLQLPKDSNGNRKRTKVSNGSRTRFAKTHSRQQAITGFLRPQPDESIGSLMTDHSADNCLQGSSNRRGNSIDERQPPFAPLPLLSILDTIEPNAPRFLRIAARSAKQTLSQGRSSVQQKMIKLATRQDQVDAMSVLEKWKSGFIKQRPSVSAARKSKQRQHQRSSMFQEHTRSEATSKILFSTLEGPSRKLVRHLGDRGMVSYRQNTSYGNTKTRFTPRMGDVKAARPPVSRKAQLEYGVYETLRRGAHATPRVPGIRAKAAEGTTISKDH
ncbi:methyl methanesulfonate-sensitivity 22 [Trichoderma arundinaceum]|uniref:Methyl methanesulfonate-sensitivity 22 n=1 Tax=Trichoderma arundinaceum TaxID=490622 RepID=A0A395NXM3_TRIAR|nr:methyl methanesulfonate-sensitivity 22 [Trichoderma arundinaceum]